MRKGNQEQICVKLDTSVSAQLALEHMVSGKPKNRIINEGVLLYANIARIGRDYMRGAVTQEEMLVWLLTNAIGMVRKGGRV